MLDTARHPITRLAGSALLTLGLTACGGGGQSPEPLRSGVERTGTGGEVLEDAASFPAGASPEGTTGALPRQIQELGASTKATAQRIPVYRLYNSATGAHFYTTSETEKNSVLASQPQYSLDGVAFHAVNSYAPGLSPVYRFYNTATGVHFYTISETEKANILATQPQLHLDGVSYHASQTPGQGLLPLYRFYVPSRGFHFYTASATEKNSIIATLASTYSYEGIAYYVANTNWAAEKLPHTGLSVTQCYATNPFTSAPFFGSCESAIALSGQQDSKRRGINPMQYGSVYYFLGSFLATYAKTSCVYDTVTGLTWEGKPDDGSFRDKDNRYTHLGGGAATDTSGYIAAVNASNLCGYNDWRLPTALEFNSLLNYGDTSTTTPHLDATWFPNTELSTFWTSHIASSTQAVTAFSFHGSTGFYTRSNTMPVRLVRGTPNSASPRFTYSTIYFNSPVVGADAANNVVNDALTGLQWRRCHYGERWTGSACSGAVNIYTHANALTAADGLGGWRLPNAKEAASLLELNRVTAPFINSTAFPASSESVSWTSTAYTSDAMSKAFILSTNSGSIGTVDRTELHGMRLVRVP